jgi:hypothetical protein
VGHLHTGKTTDEETFVIQYKEGEWLGGGEHESWDEAMFLNKDYAEFLYDSLGKLLGK